MADDSGDDSSELPSQHRQYPEPSWIVAKNKLKDDFAECLVGIKRAGSLTMPDGFPKAPSPGIRLENGHVVQIPLPYNDSQAIITASRDVLVERGESEESIGTLFLPQYLSLSLL
jgi:hypothetical protein